MVGSGSTVCGRSRCAKWPGSKGHQPFWQGNLDGLKAPILMGVAVRCSAFTSPPASQSRRCTDGRGRDALASVPHLCRMAEALRGLGAGVGIALDPWPGCYIPIIPVYGDEV